MPESPESSNDIVEIRRELRRLNDKVDGVGAEVKDIGDKVDEVDHKIERGNATRLAAFAATLDDDDDGRWELLMSANGMSNAEIAKARGIPNATVRKRLSRARRRARRKGGGN